MTADDRIEFATIVAALAELHGKELTDAATELYFRALADVEIAEFRKAAATAARTCKFFPKPVEILDLVRGPGNDRAALAWTELQQQVSSVGGYGKPEFADPALTETVRLLGGWEDVCWPREAEPWMRKRFAELYQSVDLRRAEHRYFAETGAPKELPE